VGNCVGKRNYKYFVGFITSTTLLSAYTWVLILIVLTKDYELRYIDPTVNFGLIFTGFYSIGIFLTLFPFSCYHYSLIIKGVTTNESVRGKLTRYGKNPFDDGCKQNCGKVWRWYPSRVLESYEVSDYPYEIHAQRDDS